MRMKHIDTLPNGKREIERFRQETRIETRDFDMALRTYGVLASRQDHNHREGLGGEL